MALRRRRHHRCSNCKHDLAKIKKERENLLKARLGDASRVVDVDVDMAVVLSLIVPDLF